MATPTPTEFLLARIAEDEAAFRAEAAGVEWLTVNGRNLWDRLLADCKAKRRIVKWHTETEDCCEERYGAFQFDADPKVSAGTDIFGELSVRKSIGFQPYLGCVTLMMLALPYADHPDYREEWKP